MPMNLHNIRVDDELWTRAKTRAKDESTSLSTLVRQWLTDYVETGSVGRQPKVRLSAAEKRALREKLSHFADVMADTINEQR